MSGTIRRVEISPDPLVPARHVAEWMTQAALEVRPWWAKKRQRFLARSALAAVSYRRRASDRLASCFGSVIIRLRAVTSLDLSPKTP
jgi:hypothetical protein